LWVSIEVPPSEGKAVICFLSNGIDMNTPGQVSILYCNIQMQLGVAEK